MAGRRKVLYIRTFSRIGVEHSHLSSFAQLVCLAAPFFAGNATASVISLGVKQLRLLSRLQRRPSVLEQLWRQVLVAAQK